MGFSYGDLVLVEDNKGRRSLTRLEEGQAINTHVGKVDASSILGLQSGATLKTSTEKVLSILTPTLTDFVLYMPRGAQVIYPKDLASIVFRLNVGCGSKVLEAGVGSGALSSALLRIGCNVSGVEAREDYRNLARKNVASFLGEDALLRYSVELGDIYSSAPPGPFDAVVLDLPEPWRALGVVRDVIAADGILGVYVTNVTQLLRVSEDLRSYDFGHIEAVELLEREWYLSGVVARPQHRMVGHTGFILTARPRGVRTL